MKVKLFIAMLAVLAIVGGAYALPAAAAGPVNVSPAAAMVIDNGTHTVPANSALFYKFDYAGDRSQIIVTLVNGNNINGLHFKVFTPAQIGDWWETAPIGQGTAQPLDCTTNRVALGGACQSSDLIWIGQFNASGTYYVELLNTSSSDLSAQLTIQGTGVTLAPQTAPTTPITTTTGGQGSTTSPSSTNTTGGQGGAAVPTPTTSSGAPTTVTTVANTDPGHASFIDNGTHAVPANGSLFYKFNYAGDRSQIVVTLVNASNSGLHFNVFTPGQIGDWWNEAPIGRGTAQTLDCSSNEPATNGACQSNDLSWSGKFNLNGTYYVQVTNSNNSAVNASLMISGSAVALK